MVAYGMICMTLKTFKSNLNLKKVRYHIKHQVPLWFTLHMETLSWAERLLGIPAWICCPRWAHRLDFRGVGVYFSTHRGLTSPTRTLT